MCSLIGRQLAKLQVKPDHQFANDEPRHGPAAAPVLMLPVTWLPRQQMTH